MPGRPGACPRGCGSARLLTEDVRPTVPAVTSVGDDRGMGKLVYDFTEGNKDQKDLLGGKGANLAEMTRLGTAGPPRIHHQHRGLPGVPRPPADGLPEGHWRRRSTSTWRPGGGHGPKLGQTDDPLLVSVRSGAKFSMPGMMETVLNVGLNDVVRGRPRRDRCSERFAQDSYRRLLQMFGATVLGIDSAVFADELDTLKTVRGRLRTSTSARKTCASWSRRTRRSPRAHRPTSRNIHASRSMPRSSRLRLLEHRPGRALPPAGAHPRRPRHCRQRACHGVRQPRLRAPARASLHTGPRERVAASTATTWRCPGRGRRRRHPQHAAARRPPAVDQPSFEALLASWRCSSATTATCVTSSSPSRTAAVDPPDPCRQAHPGGGFPDRRAMVTRG